jgi:hypothetical protein
MIGICLAAVKLRGGPFEGLPAHRHLESISRPAVAQPTHAGDEIKLVGVGMESIIDEVVVHVNMDDLAENHIACCGHAWVGAQDLEGGAFEGNG